MLKTAPIGYVAQIQDEFRQYISYLHGDVSLSDRPFIFNDEGEAKGTLSHWRVVGKEVKIQPIYVPVSPEPKKVPAPPTPEEFEAIRARSAHMASLSPKIERVYFDVSSGDICTIWKYGAKSIVPARIIQVLRNHKDEDLIDVQIIQDGQAINFPSIDVQLTATAFLQLSFNLHNVKAKSYRELGETSVQ